MNLGFLKVQFANQVIHLLIVNAFNSCRRYKCGIHNFSFSYESILIIQNQGVDHNFQSWSQYFARILYIVPLSLMDIKFSNSSPILWTRVIKVAFILESRIKDGKLMKTSFWENVSWKALEPIAFSSFISLTIATPHQKAASQEPPPHPFSTLEDPLSPQVTSTLAPPYTTYKKLKLCLLWKLAILLKVEIPNPLI